MRHAIAAGVLASVALAGEVARGLRCHRQQPLRRAVSDFVSSEALPWLSSWALPRASEQLLRLVPSHEDGTASEEQCEAEAAVVAQLLSSYVTIASAVGRWNDTALAPEQTGVGAFGTVVDCYNGFLRYQAAKTEVLSRFSGADDLLDGWPLPEGEVLIGMAFRVAWLRLARAAAPGAPHLVQAQCACRTEPETQSLLFDRFDEMRAAGDLSDFSFSLFQCPELAFEADFADVLQALPLVRETSFTTCAPRDVIIRAACAQRALRDGDAPGAVRLMDAAVNLMLVAMDCFGHTPWTAGDRSVPSAEVFFNWAQFQRRGAAPWQRLPSPSAATQRAAAGPRYAARRPACAADLGPACVDLASGRLSVFHGESRGSAEVFLPQCGDAYGEWRRAWALPSRSLRLLRRRGVDEGRAGFILHMSQISLTNLWHLLHLLLPAVDRLRRRGRADADGAGGDFELVLDGLYAVVAEGRARGVGGRQLVLDSVAGRFIDALSGGRFLVLGDPGQPSAMRCYKEAFWGHEALTLFGRDKGGLGVEAARAASSEVARLPLFAQPALLPTWPSPPSGRPRTWRVLFVARPKGEMRGLENEAEVATLLDGLAAQTLRVDFASAPLRGDVVAQLQLAGGSDVLAGPLGAGLAWAAFMRPGRAVVELMPYLRVLRDQLCRRDPVTGSCWGATPMYAYGGLSAVVGVRHCCVLGAPAAGAADRDRSLATELGSWVSAPIRVDLAALERALREALERLDADLAAGRL